MDYAYDKSELSHLDVSLRTMVDRSYELCLHRCNMKPDSLAPCKKSCFNNIQVAYRHTNHIAKDGEENAYRKCLASKDNFPALSQEDFISCSNGVF